MSLPERVELGTSGEITISEGVLIGGGLLATWWSGDGWGRPMPEGLSGS